MFKSSQELQPQLAVNRYEDGEEFRLLHPFLTLLAGMTGSEKTVWVQHIMWCYTQWQPAYEQMQQSVTGIEFVKCIPVDLEED